MLRELISLANKMDQRGLRKEVDYLDEIIYKSALIVAAPSAANINTLIVWIQKGSAAGANTEAINMAKVSLRTLRRIAQHSPQNRLLIQTVSKQLGWTGLRAGSTAAVSAGTEALTQGTRQIATQGTRQIATRQIATQGTRQIATRGTSQVARSTILRIFGAETLKAAGLVAGGYALTGAAVLALFGGLAYMTIYPIQKARTNRGMMEYFARIYGRPVWLGVRTKTNPEGRSDFNKTTSIRLNKWLATAWMSGPDGQTDPTGLIAELLNDEVITNETVEGIKIVAEYLKKEGERDLEKSRTEDAASGMGDLPHESAPQAREADAGSAGSTASSEYDGIRDSILANRDAALEFRGWVNDNNSALSKVETALKSAGLEGSLDRIGPTNNDYMRVAWNAIGNDFVKGYQVS